MRGGMLLRAAQSVPPDLSGRAGHDKQGEAVSLALGTIIPVAPLHSYRPSLANTNWLGLRGGSQAVSLGQLPVLYLRPYAGNPVPVWVEIQIGFVGSPGDEENHVVAWCCPSQSVMADGPVTFRLEEQHTWQLFSSIREFLVLTLLVQAVWDIFGIAYEYCLTCFAYLTQSKFAGKRSDFDNERFHRKYFCGY